VGVLATARFPDNHTKHENVEFFFISALCHFKLATRDAIKVLVDPEIFKLSLGLDYPDNPEIGSLTLYQLFCSHSMLVGQP